MAKEIKQKIVLEGEKQYNAAIKEAQRNLKTLKSELKAETAELGKNATEQQKAEAKTKSLQKQIAEQEKIVKALREALQEVRDKYGDNAEETARWEQKLNNARATLANMKNDLDGVSGSFKNINTDAAAATVATKSVADALGKIGEAGGNVSSAIENIFTGMIDKVSEVVEQLWDMITETAGRANNWTDLASYYGSSAQEIQMWSRSIQAAGGDFEKFQGIVNKLAFGGKEKKITEALGISKENYQNDIQYTLAVLDELQKRKDRLGQNWYDGVMNELFGAKKSADVSWFLGNANGHMNETTGEWVYGWRDNPERFNGNESGYGMSDEELQTMNDLYVTLQSIETKWQALKDNFAAGFGTAALSLMVNVEGTLDGIADYMNATDDAEKEAALQKIRTNVENFFTKLGEIIRDSIHIIKDVGMELKESDDPLTSAIGDILVKLSEALQWMVDNQEAVKTALEAIFGIWLMGKLLAVAGQLGSIIMQIEAIQAFRGFGAVTSAAEAAGTTAGASWGASFGAAVMKAVPWLAGLLVWAENALTPQGNDDLYDENGNPTELGQSLGYTKTQQEEEEEWRNSEAVQNSIWGAKGDRIEDAGIVTRSQYAALNNLWENYSGLVKTSASQEELLEKARKEFEGQEDLFNEYIRKIYELRNSGEKPGELPLEWFGIYGPEEVEDVDLDENPGYSDQDKEQAVQDWWDAWRNASKGEDSWDEEASAFQWFQEVFGDDFGDVWDRIIQKLDETKDQTKLEDLPEDWYRTTGNWGGSGTANENGITSTDLQGFRGLPANIQVAVQKGAAAGVSGIKVNLDGRTVGELVAPYVSAAIARDIV